jgi:hypothetical protein
MQHTTLVKYAQPATQQAARQQSQYKRTRPVLHHNFQLAVSFLALPHRDEMQHVHALCMLAVFFAFFATELNAAHSEKIAISARVHHLNEARVKVNL